MPAQPLEIAAFDDFDRVVDPKVYAPLPDEWQVGVSDVVGSTDAIAQGRYKAVNMAGAAAISAVMNALGSRDFPFVFGGDGAGFAVPGEASEKVRDALSRTARWVKDELRLELRTALVPLARIREAGHDVLVARYAPSPNVRYAMFMGGGLEWAEGQLKAGRIALAAAPAGARPDLTGLSCRWEPIAARKGVILSLIVKPAIGASQQAYRSVLRKLLALLAAEEGEGHPVTAPGLVFSWPPKGFDLEARTANEGSLFLRRLRVLAYSLFAWVLFKTGLRVGQFDPQRYRANAARNSDFRKFGDGLNMTVDCDAAIADRAEALLREAEQQGVVRFGAYRQSAALMTCIVPSPLNDDHMHFIDGAGGGYARAARQLKGG